MAKITRRHKPGCNDAKRCDCPYRLDFRPAGTYGPRKGIEFSTKKEAEKFLDDNRQKGRRGEYIAPARIPTFGAVAEEWLREKINHHPATLEGYRGDVRHLKPIHGLRLDMVNVAALEQIRDDLRDRNGFAPKTISAVLTTASAVFKLAIRRGYTTSNPAAIAERPRKAVKELIDDAAGANGKQGLRPVRPDEVLTATEIAKLLAHAEPGLYRTLFATVAATGLRPEEAYALQWGDVQFDSAQIFVRRSLSMARGANETGKVKPKFYPPKTESGYRVLSIPAPLVTALKAWKLQCPVNAHELVFCRADGNPLHRKNVLSCGLHPASRRAGLRRINLKTLRHSFASGLIAAGAPITEVQHRLLGIPTRQRR
jgi:integrase